MAVHVQNIRFYTFFRFCTFFVVKYFCTKIFNRLLTCIVLYSITGCEDTQFCPQSTYQAILDLFIRIVRIAIRNSVPQINSSSIAIQYALCKPNWKFGFMHTR